MALGIYLGGTTGLADGTLEVPGDGIGVTLGPIGSVGTFHIRAASGKQNAEQVTVNAPDDCEVSADGTTYAATAVYAIGAIQDVNVAVYIKRTGGATAVTTGGTTTPRLALITEEAISPYWSDDFADGIINPYLWETEVLAPGAITESGGNIVMADGTGSGRWVLQSKKPMTIGTAQKLTVNGIISGADLSNLPGLSIIGDDTVYPAEVTDDMWSKLQVHVSFYLRQEAPSGREVWISYWDTDGTRRTWNAGSFNTTLAGTASTAIVSGAEYSVEFETNASSQWRIKITVGGSVLLTTTWVAFSATRAGTSPRISTHDVGAAVTHVTYTSASLAAV